MEVTEYLRDFYIQNIPMQLDENDTCRSKGQKNKNANRVPLSLFII